MLGEPVNLNLPHIDPGHVVGSDGQRYLHLSGGYKAMVPFSAGEGKTIFKDFLI